MVTINVRKEMEHGVPYVEAYGLSSEEKPKNVYNGSLFIEIDTSKMFFFDQEGTVWREFE